MGENRVNKISGYFDTFNFIFKDLRILFTIHDCNKIK